MWYIKCLLTEWIRTHGNRCVGMSWPQAEYFPCRRSFHLVNKNILYCAHTISKCANCAFKILGCQGCGIKSWSRSHDAAVFQGTSVSQHCFSLLAFVKHYAKNPVDRNISFSFQISRCARKRSTLHIRRNSARSVDLLQAARTKETLLPNT